MNKKILDVTCGARSIWFNKRHPAAVYCDKRREQFRHLWKNAGNCTLDIDPASVLENLTDRCEHIGSGIPLEGHSGKIWIPERK